MTINRGVLVTEQGPQPVPRALSPTVIGIVGTGVPASPATPVEVNTPTEVDDPEHAQTLFGDEGTIYAAMVGIHDQVNARAIAVRFDHTISGAARETAVEAAIRKLEDAEEDTGLKPTILIAPGETYDKGAQDAPETVANGAFTALESVAEDLEAVAVADGPPGTVAQLTTWVGNNAGARVLSTYPEIEIAGLTGDHPGSPVVAGLMARNDELAGGLSIEPSNKRVFGVTSGTKRISWSRSATSDLHRIEALGVMTFVFRNGMRTFGGDMTADQPFDKISARRVTDHVEDVLEQAGESFIDANRDSATIDQVNSIYQSSLGALAEQGLIRAGSTSTPDVAYNANVANQRARRAKFNIALNLKDTLELITIDILATNIQ